MTESWRKRPSRVISKVLAVARNAIFGCPIHALHVLAAPDANEGAPTPDNANATTDAVLARMEHEG